ncbi:hypothetical protein D3C86_2130070 [compost metagenome]
MACFDTFVVKIILLHHPVIEIIVVRKLVEAVRFAIGRRLSGLCENISNACQLGFARLFEIQLTCALVKDGAYIDF